MTDSTEDTKPEVITPAETDQAAFDALMDVLTRHGGFTEQIGLLGIKVPDLFDPLKARINAHAIATYLRKAANELCDATRPPGQPRVRELYSIHGEASGVWFCEKCRLTCRSEWEATVCCAPRYCDKCKVQFKERQYHCDSCFRIEQTAKEQERWAKAEPIDAAAYTGEMIYVEYEDGSPYGGSYDGYFSSVEELAETVADAVYEDDGDPTPTLHIYATRASILTWDAADQVDSALENQEFFDGAKVSGEAITKLQEFLDQWSSEYSPTGYWPDYSKKIVGWEAYIPAQEESSDA